MTALPAIGCRLDGGNCLPWRRSRPDCPCISGHGWACTTRPARSTQSTWAPFRHARSSTHPEACAGLHTLRIRGFACPATTPGGTAVFENAPGVIVTNKDWTQSFWACQRSVRTYLCGASQRRPPLRGHWLSLWPRSGSLPPLRCRGVTP